MADPTARPDAPERPPAGAGTLRLPQPWWGYGVVAGVALAVVLGVWGLWTVLSGGGSGRDGSAHRAADIERLQQEIATLKRSDQISRDANQELQATLALRDEEIAALRADVAFYERFVGATAQPRGLSVHELELRPQQNDGRVWRYVATLTQTRDRDTPSEGRLTLSLEGTRDGKLQRLSWSDLRQQPDAPGQGYAFKYFQRVEGDLMLPAGFVPLRVNARLVPARGAAVERTFPWAEVAGTAPTG